MNPILDTLNDRQKEAVLHTEGPLLVRLVLAQGRRKSLRAALLIY